MLRLVLSCVVSGLISASALAAQNVSDKAGSEGVSEDPAVANPEAERAAEKEIAPGIVVRGERLPDKTINRYIYDMLRPQAAGDDSQYPRLSAPFCPSVIGFGEDVEKAIETRMRRVATAAGIAVSDRADCRPNMHLVRVEDGPKMIKLLRRKKPRQAFGWMLPHERSGLERLPGPAYSWQQTFSFSTEGGLVVPTGSTPGTFGEPPVNYVAPGCQSPRLCMPVSLSFRHAIVLIERDSLDDVSVVQLADYALMRGLAQVREDRYRAGSREADTILNLFDASIPPEERMLSLGRMDLAMLTALYAAPSNVNSNRQRGRMVKTFRAALEELE